MKRIWIIFFSIICALTSFGQRATGPGGVSLDDLDKNQLLTINPVGDRGKLISKFQEQEGKKLLNGPLMRLGRENEKINVEKMRGGEVLIVTVPASLLFMPNQTELRSDAAPILSSFTRYLKEPDMYWVVLDMHSDNTGNEAYTDSITLERVTSVFRWFSDGGYDTTYLFPTASGSSDPLPGSNNISMTERAANRRLEIYLIPGKRMIDQAKKGRIAF